MKEVYCSDCKYLVGLNREGTFLCWSKEKKDFMGEKECEFCFEKNELLDCKEYEEEKKWRKFWRKRRIENAK